jgi:hypothetical protein
MTAVATEPGIEEGSGEELEASPSSGGPFGKSGLFGWPAVLVVSAVVTAFSWRDRPWRPVGARLNSWQAGITLGFLHHIQWGPQLLFTFGPYGFVEDILPFSRSTAALALLYALVVTLGLVVLIVSALRETWGLLPAGIAAWVAVTIAANMLQAPELATATALGLTLASFRAASFGGERDRHRLLLLGALGALAGFQLLVEISVGLVCTGLLVVAVVSQIGRLRALGTAGLPFLFVPLLALMAGGQSIGNVSSYIRGSLSIATGYGSAMSISSGRVAEYLYAAIDVGVLVWLSVDALRDRPLVERVAIPVALTGWVWEALKEGFVRHDLHDLTFFALILIALCLTRTPRSSMAVQAGAIGVAAVIACLAHGGPPAPLHSPAENLHALAAEVRDVTSAQRWAPVQQTAVAEIRNDGDRLPPGLLASLQGRTMAAVPMEDGMAFAYRSLDWDPEPVLQSYNAYTSYLDQLDANFLASAAAPQRILYRQGTIDGRNPAWDPPAAMMSMYCHYVRSSVTDGWLILVRTGDRCGQPQLIKQVTGHFGMPIAVPSAPGRMVVATFSLASPSISKLEGLLLKPPSIQLTSWDAGSPPSSYRFVPGTAPDYHVLAAPASLDYPAGFSPSKTGQLEISGGGWPSGQGALQVNFYSVDIAAR